MDKRALRAEMRERVSALGGAYIEESDAGIFENVISLPEYAAAETVFLYYSEGREPGTHRLLEHILKSGKTAALPRVIGNGVMTPLRVTDAAELMPGAYGLLEPPETAEQIPVEDIDLIIVPAAAFDTAGYRLGRGGGYYDRFLAGACAFSAGLARERLLLDEVPRQAYDRRVSCLVTEKRIARFG